ncbi:MAG TPA: DUF1579 family protein [Candidatus Polarisedimenticolia bacterium]|nr:DUF1579 family protein [Candidatus Polarisedimenticolia bacterium]
MQMEMPKVTEHHAKLKDLAGTWVAEEQISPSPWDPEGGPAVGKATARVDVDGFFLLMDYVQERGGKVSYRGHGVYGWDAKEKCYTMHWFDSFGMPLVGPARGTWEGNRLMFQNNTPMGQGRYIYEFEGDGRYRFKIENSPDGNNWTTFMEGRYTRKK